MFPILMCNFQSCCLEPVYGVISLQLFGAVTDSLTAYYEEAGGGWGQPYNVGKFTTPLLISVVSNLPTLVDTLSKPRISLAGR
jgi:hypothetical protein